MAGMWTVKDVAAHLLDGNIKDISIYRDQTELRPDEEIKSYLDIVNYLNRINADWVRAMKRMSTELLIEWLTVTHEPYITCLEKLDPGASAKFSVAWAGDSISPNWFHIAREFTEKWHHQQQIRDALNQSGILTKEFYFPVLETFMRALPYRYKNILAPTGTCVQISVASAAGGSWFLEKEAHQWKLRDKVHNGCLAKVTIPAEISWKLFTKAVQYVDVRPQLSIEGDERLVLPALQMVTVMA